MGDIVNAVADVFGFGPASKQADATTEAANISAQGTREAIALQKAQYEQSRADQEPWRQAGVNALGKLQGMADYTMFGPEQFTKDPGYGFRLAEGRKALASKARARGGLVSGQTLKGMQDYAQESASNEFSNAFNRYQIERAAKLGPYQTLAGIGQTATNQLGALGTGYANQATQLGMTNAANQGNLALQTGNIRATQYGNYGNVLGNALSKYNFSGGSGNTYTGAGQVNPSSGEYMGSLEF
jgi:hypothetical protein